ncbi:hypothetical protein [Burkholderia sp. Se-20373]|uniref:hypothetical protein n=1 Tax=Burkholderia sp. Se-20373 TaxID=2703898 RepID=UPI0019821398|nr:hypothetical protein [Burkholderia sp. Se-20373]
MNVRSFNSVVDEARLVASPAETVAKYLEDRGAQVAKQPFSDTADEQFGQAQLERHDPLIDLPVVLSLNVLFVNKIHSHEVDSKRPC